ncbi:MAG TPA: EAL domain-containing protein [Burkholderiales bacterium]|nr:EAL domain-containing protein [Burkholderiales bacterium]
MSKLFRYSSFVGLVAVVAVIVALSWFYRRLAFDALVETETRSNVALTRTFANSIWPRYAGFVRYAGQIPPHDLRARAEIGDLQQDLRVLAKGLDVVKVKIYNLDGLTVFSTDFRQIGEDKSGNPGFLGARVGATASEITFRDRFDAWEGVINDRNLIATYVPVHTDAAAPVEAVMEVYSDVTGLVSKMERTQSQIITGVVGALSALYLLMLWMAGRADRILRKQEAQRVANEERIRYQAYHDLLTGLPNRTSFAEHLEEAMRRSKRFGWSVALMFLDVDRFKRVNDSLGHEAGDELLRIVASRLKTCIRETDILFRMGGDEFTVLLENVRTPEEVAAVAARMISAVAQPAEIAHHELTPTASIGIAIYPRDDQRGERLVKAADAAMYRAKDVGRNRYAFFTQEMTERVESQLRLEADLERALKLGEFVLHYQPRVSTATRRVVSIEALLRWNKPQAGLVAPGGFVPLLEESGLIVPVGAWVLRTACRQAKVWQETGLPAMRISVNISSRQFRNEALVETIRDALESSGLAPECLELELTESLLVESAENAVTIMQRLKALGVTLSIDDFGTGYSSLNYLKRFPIDCLKIDSSFVHDLHTSAKDAAIVEAISALAKSLGIGLVAEGVEEVRQADFLRARYCTELQGFLFSHPLAADEIVDAVRRLAPESEETAGVV